MSRRVDEIDRRIIYRLMLNARNTTAPEIAEKVNVSPGTVRNRIKQLEKDGIIRGYHADIDYERVGKKLVNLFKCSSSVHDRRNLAKKALRVSGVVNVREVMSGQEDLHIKAVGESIEDVTRIASDLVKLGIEIEDQDLIRREYFHPYHVFGPEGKEMEPIVDFRTISGIAETADLTVVKGAPVDGKTVEEINDLGLLGEDLLLVAIERGEEIVTPRGDTLIKARDVVTVFSPTEIAGETLEAFTKKSDES